MKPATQEDHTEQGPFEVIDLDSPFVFGIGRKCTPKELEQARKAGRFDEVPMSVLAITQDGVAGVMGKGTARLFAAAPALLAALVAQEEAEAAKQAIVAHNGAKEPSEGWDRGALDAWHMQMQKLRDDAEEKQVTAKILRAAALSATNH